jgi:hypothetical protein
VPFTLQGGERERRRRGIHQTRHVFVTGRGICVASGDRFGTRLYMRQQGHLLLLGNLKVALPGTRVGCHDAQYFYPQL